MAEASLDFEQRLREASEQLYKHSHDLATRNKTLSLLRKLYQISISTLNSDAVARQMVSTIRETLEFELVGILLLDRAGDRLKPLRFASSDRLSPLFMRGDASLDTLAINKASTVPFFSPLLARKVSRTTRLEDVWGTVSSKETLDALTASGHLKQVLGYPLIIEDEVLGVLILALNRTEEELSQYERESIDSIVDVVAIALDHTHLYEELKLANERQVLLIHFITHQIKGFVAKSRNIFSMILEGEYGPLPETMKPVIEEGFKSNTKGAATIQEILNASNIKSGKVTYTMAPFDLKALTEEIAKDLRPGAEAKGLALKLALGDTPMTVTGDRAQLTNAFKNLIDNSIKYTQKGEVDVTLTRQADKVVFRIQDTGVGITPEDMASLFTEGGHGKESTKVNVESTGFGLYIVKSIIEAHHGKVWAESEGAGKGSRFIVELPT